jgi:hypothetical protein
MASDAPELEAEAADILDLYLHPLLSGSVFGVDEKTALKALDRLDPVLPVSPGLENICHGTLSLYAALKTQTGVVSGKTATRHTGAEFVTVLREIVASRKTDRPTHANADNFSVQKTKNWSPNFLRGQRWHG